LPTNLWDQKIVFFSPGPIPTRSGAVTTDGVNRLAKIVAILAIAWAGFAPSYFLYRDAVDQQQRLLTALAVGRLGATANDMTNQVIRIPRQSVDAVRHLAKQEARRSAVSSTLLLVSSGAIVKGSVPAIVKGSVPRNYTSAYLPKARQVILHGRPCMLPATSSKSRRSCPAGVQMQM
jgi:hypothetical protein